MASKPRFSLTHVDATKKIISEEKKINGLLRRRTGNPASLGGVGLGQTGSSSVLSGVDGKGLPPPVNCDDAATKCYVDSVIAALVDLNNLSTASTIIERIIESVSVGSGTNEYTTTGFIEPRTGDFHNVTLSETADVQNIEAFQAFPTDGRVGDSISVSSISIPAGEYGSLALTIKINGITVGTVTAAANGSFTKSITVPSLVPGAYTMTLSASGIVDAVIPFTVDP